MPFFFQETCKNELNLFKCLQASFWAEDETILFLIGGHLGISLREIMFLFPPLFSLPFLTLFQFLIGFLNRSNRLGEMSLWLMWLWRMTSTNGGGLKHFATSSLLHGVWTSRGSFSAPDWSSTKALTSPWSKHCSSLAKTLSQRAESAVLCWYFAWGYNRNQAHCGWDSNKTLLMKKMSIYIYIFFSNFPVR